jgi:hypothetical protein
VPLTLLFGIGCSDAVAPRAIQGPNDDLAGYEVSWSQMPTDINVLRQSPDAPALETYSVAFWARRDRASYVAVDYVNGDPFMRFYIPRDGIKSTLEDRRIDGRDSVLITVTIDPRTFAADFQPQGLQFDKRHPASLWFWYEHADQDCNGDGVVDDADRAILSQLSVFKRPTAPAEWQKVFSEVTQGLPLVYTQMKHFSIYAVSW